jgi:hypothetical protein
MLRAMNQYKNAWHEMKMWYNSVAMAYVGLAVTLALAHSCLRKMSVVNRYLQSWEVSNVFVQGACIYPQNPGYNPTDTVGTLAYWTAQAIREQYLKHPGPLVR